MQLDNEYFVKVTRDGNTLVAAYEAANPPLVWKFDLDRNHSFSLVLRGQDSDWQLGVSAARSEFYPIANFRSRQDAEEAFEATQNGLLKKNASVWRAVSFVLIPVVIVLLLLVTILFRAVGGQHVPTLTRAPVANSMNGLNSEISSPAPQVPIPPPIELKEGVPMSADDVLRPPTAP